MLRVRQNTVDRCRLLHPAALQHHHPIRHLSNHRQIVRDVHRRGVKLSHHIAERPQHLDLRGHVQCSRRLVQDHQFWPGDQRHGRHQALQLAARDLMWKPLADIIRIGQRKSRKQCARLRLRLGARHQPVNQGGFGHLCDDPLRGIERSRRALRHVAHPLPAQPGKFTRRKRQHVSLAQPYRSAGDRAARARVSHQRQCRRGLARSRFPDQRQHLAPRDGEAEIRQNRNLSCVLSADDRQAFDLHMRPRAIRHNEQSRGPAGCRSAD